MNSNTVHSNFSPSEHLAYRLGCAHVRMIAKAYSLDEANKEPSNKFLKGFSGKERIAASLGATCALHQLNARKPLEVVNTSKEFTNAVTVSESLVSFLGYKDAVDELRKDLAIPGQHPDYIAGIKHVLRSCSL